MNVGLCGVFWAVLLSRDCRLILTKNRVIRSFIKTKTDIFGCLQTRFSVWNLDLHRAVDNGARHHQWLVLGLRIQKPKAKTGFRLFSTRQHAERAICYRKSVCLSVRPSVCLSHGWISRKQLNLGSCNFYHTVAPSLCFLRYKFHPEIPTGSPKRGRQTMVGCGLAGNDLFL